MEHFVAREMRMRMTGPRVRMHDVLEPLGASSAHFEVVQYKAAARFQRAVHFANGQLPRGPIEMVAAIGNENAIQCAVSKQAARGRLTYAR
jgi:hypothetical protein